MQNTVIYACPTCRARLENSSEALSCKTCQTAYPIVDGIPDFVSEDATLDTSPHLKWANKNYNLQARIYEKSRYPWRLFLYGEFGAPSFKELVRFTSDIVDIDKGQILDAACGPGTLGRRIASQSKIVYGIDISWAMLHQGAAYVKRSHIANFHLARAKAENLPFKDARFDAALCGSALHFFADPVSTLCEIGRTMKEGAPLAVVTLLEKNNKKSLFRRFRDRLLQPPSAHLFKVPELEQITAKAGFEDFQPRVYGSMILFSVRKKGKKGA